MRKWFVALMATGLVLTAGSGVALAAGGDISPTTYNLPTANTDVWAEYNQGVAVQSAGNTVYFNGSTTSAHPYGTWNSPYTAGIDGYNYNDPQSYTNVGDQADSTGDGKADTFSAGPHGGYLTSTHRCRECHAVHRAAGKFKLLRSDTRFEACDWCHGFGAGSGFNIQMDNDDNITTEYNVGHTLGFGIQTGKWRAPDDTYPAYTPNYWLGGFSCFDCHSPHANPTRMLGFDGLGNPVGEETQTTINGVVMTRVYGIANPGHDILPGDPTHISTGPVYLSGSWLLIKDPDRETARTNTTVASGITGDPDITVTAGAEIPDAITFGLNEFDNTTTYPVNKIATDWNSPIGAASTSDTSIGYNQRNMLTSKRIWNVSEFCTDCHDGNAGLHTIQAPLFSEDRALRGQGHSTDTPEWKGNYDLAYGHDAQPRH
ncbi:MAG: hypothetical protein ACYC56_08555 [Candidatus Aquicultor sp.]